MGTSGPKNTKPPRRPEAPKPSTLNPKRNVRSSGSEGFRGQTLKVLGFRGSFKRIYKGSTRVPLRVPSGLSQTARSISEQLVVFSTDLQALAIWLTQS